ncbi:hypothetical protein [Armatimonas sp.]|uniref:hypothetical protein n=1 Tax=Armatimonas sp. TaxID=1872638 RepID=UPI00374D8ACC
MPFVQDRFAIGFWVDPPRDARVEQRYKEISEAGFNLVLAGFQSGPLPTLFRLLKKFGLKCILSPQGSEPSTFPTDPNVWGYALQDEPSASEFPKLKVRAEAIERLHPGKLAYVNLFPDYASPAQLGSPDYATHVKQFIETVKPAVLSMDHYPIFHPDRDGRDRYCGNLAVMREQSLVARIPFWNFFNSMPYGPHTDPTESQLRWQIYASLAYGAKGVLYFCYFTPGGAEFPKGGAIIAMDGTKTRHYAHAQRLNAELRALGPTLMQLTSTGVYRVKPTDNSAEALRGSGLLDLKRAPEDPPGDYLVGAFRHKDGRRAVLLQNYRFAYSAWPTVVFDAPLESVREVDKVTGKEAPVRDESPNMPGLQLSLGDAEGRLFLLPN